MSLSKDSVGLIKNTTAMSFIQVCNYIFPLLLIPYLSRVLGLEIYGIVALGLGISQIAFIVTDYGFNLSATYKIAKANGDKKIINEIMSSVFFCKLGLLLLIIILLTLFITFDSKYVEYHFFFWMIILPVIGQAFQPVWFFQGLEKMIIISIITSVGRTFYLFSTIFLVKSANDLVWVAMTNGFSHLLIAFLELLVIFRLGYSFILPQWVMIKKTFNESTPFFWGRAAAAIYTAGGTVFLGIFSTPIQTGLYSAAEQLYRGGVSLIVPLHQALYPYMVRTRNIAMFKKILKISAVISLLGVTVSIFISPWVIEMIFGHEFYNSRPAMIVFMITFLFAMPSGLLGFPFLAALGDSKTANMSIIYGGFIQFFLLIICLMLGWISAFQVASCVLLVEMAVFIIRARASLILNRRFVS